MKSSAIENLLSEIKDKSVPFYKKRIFIILTIIVLIIIIVMIIIVVATIKRNITFSSDFKESIKYIKNPDQGFYNPLRVTLTPSSISYGKSNPDQIYHLRCDINQFSKMVNGETDKELTNITLIKLEEFLSKIKSENKNAVIRFSYDKGYDGNTNSEPSMEMIEMHIKQLSTVLNKFYYTLTAIEAGMLGPWGEMHTSDIATEANKAKVFKCWLLNTKNIPILARTPKAIFYYFGKNLEQMEKYEIKEEDEGYNLGVFNDCYLSSDTDVGTYRYNRTREVNWLSKQNEHLPYGGETCEVDKISDLDKAIPEMYKLGLSYLNIDYNKNVIAKWKNLTYDSSLGKDSIYYGVSGFDYIKTHMGYRLVLRSFNITYKKGDKFELNINIDNVGFGNLIKPKNIDIIFTDMSNNILSTKNYGKYSGEKVIKISGTLLDKSHEDYKVFIKLYGFKENNNDFYFIQFANENIFNEKINANYLFQISKGEIKK